MKNNTIPTLRHYFVCVLLVGLTACGGGGSDGDTSIGGDVATASGIFKDSNVSGASYVSGAQAGVTGPDGSFTYEVGQPVTFSVGGVTIGTAMGKSVVTPIDLVAGGNISSQQVQNIVRFLTMLDSDGDPDNGISISSAVQAMAGGWTQVDFGAADLGAELTLIMSDVASADGRAPILISASTAESLMEATLLCVRAGAFSGKFNGGDSGTFGVLVDATNGFLAGFAFSNNNQAILALNGMTAISLDQLSAFVSGNASTGATFTGKFTTPDQIGGSWQNTLFSISGEFSGDRIGGIASAAYRFTGGFSGDDFGLFAFDVDGSDNITGVAYSVAGDEALMLTGVVSGTSVSATASDGTTITGTLDKATGTLSGSWDDAAEGISGSYSGSGCKLN